MISKNIPRDISQYKAKLMLGLTTRQVVLFVPGAALGVGAFFLLRDMIGEAAILVAIIVAAPFILFASFKPLGMPLEQFIKKALIPMFLAPATRRYKCENTYESAFKGIENEFMPPEEKAAKAKKKQSGNYVSKIPEHKAL